MIKKFLNFVDEATNFGALHIPGDRLFEMFVERQKLSMNVAYGFRLRLEAKGIL